MYGCETWTIKKAKHWRIDAFKLWFWGRLLRVPWTARRSNQTILKEILSWIFIGRTDAKAETPILWPPDAKNWLIGKDPDAGKDWRREEKGTTEGEMHGWHHQLNVHEFESTPGVGDGQGGLACCSPWGCKVRHGWATELNGGLLRTWMTWWWTLSFKLHCCLPMALTLYLVTGKMPFETLSWQLSRQWPLWLPDMDSTLCWLLAFFFWLEFLITWNWVPRGRPDGQAPVCKQFMKLLLVKPVLMFHWPTCHVAKPSVSVGGKYTGFAHYKFLFVFL